MEKLDLAKKYKPYYTAKTIPELTTIKPAHFLSLTRKGDPSEKQFAEKLAALYSTIYTLKFARKSIEKDFVNSCLTIHHN